MKRKRMLRVSAAIVCGVLLIATGGALYTRPLPAETMQRNNTAVIQSLPAPSLPWPAYGQAAVGTATDGILATHGDQTPVPIASVAKVMTALAVLKQKPLAPGESGPVLTITDQDIDFFEKYLSMDGSLTKVAVGEQINEYQALEALLLPSANNLADSLATWAFGSTNAYTTYATMLAKNLGMTNSSFADASGFDPATVSTAHDLFILGQTALQNPVISEIVAKRYTDIPIAGTVFNVNTLLGRYNIDGIKTGNTDQAGGVYLFSSSQTLPNSQPTRIIGVVVGAASLGQAMSASPPLINATLQSFEQRSVARSGQTFGSYTTPWNGGHADAVAKADRDLLVWGGAPTQVSVKLKPLTGTQSKGSEVGSATLTADGRTTTVPLVLAKDITGPSTWWRLTHR